MLYLAERKNIEINKLAKTSKFNPCFDIL